MEEEADAMTAILTFIALIIVVVCLGYAIHRTVVEACKTALREYDGECEAPEGEAENGKP